MKYLMFIFVLLGLSACATVNNSSVDHFRIDSVPQGAKVVTTLETPESRKKRGRKDYIPEYHGCEPTPCAIPVFRRSRFIATVTHPEYEPAEIFVSSSSKKGAFAGSMIATSVSVAGTTAASAATAATTMAIQAQFTSILVTSVLNAATFGQVPVSAAAIPTASTSSVMAAAAPPALIVTGSMLLVDAASGANKNLFPNPVVLGLAPKGQQSRVDPFVLLFRQEIALAQKADDLCVNGPAFGSKRNDDCKKAKQELSNSKKQQKEIMKLFWEAQKELAKAAKAEAMAAKKSASPDTSTD